MFDRRFNLNIRDCPEGFTFLISTQKKGKNIHLYLIENMK